MDLVSLTLIFMVMAIIGGAVMMSPEEVFAEIFIIKISDGVTVGESEPKTNFNQQLILKYNLLS